MKLAHSTWLEIETYLEGSKGIIIPTGSTEQHGPMGLIGTDAICAEEIADRGAEIVGACVAPTLAYTPAPFNMAFPGTISLSEPVYEAMVAEIVAGLILHGFEYIYFLNGHGANIAPLERVVAKVEHANFKIQSWWAYDEVNQLRQAYYSDWEGMHATPSEVAITQATHRVIAPGIAAEPPEKLTPAFMKTHAGDRHGSPDEHRKQFPDGRVGSHSALAKPVHGVSLLDAASRGLAQDYTGFMNT